jgi:hypothetical protein
VNSQVMHVTTYVHHLSRLFQLQHRQAGDSCREAEESPPVNLQVRDGHRCTLAGRRRGGRARRRGGARDGRVARDGGVDGAGPVGGHGVVGEEHQVRALVQVSVALHAGL